MNPLIYGEYPAVMKQKIANKSMEEGLVTSRLPEFTRDQRNQIKGTRVYSCLRKSLTTLNMQDIVA